MTWCTAQLAKLDKSPLFQLSLGSKELFHSNFLAWMFREFSGPASRAVGERLGIPLGKIADPQRDISREYLNLDLSVRFDDGQLLVIENKVKSLPDLGQLERYESKIADKHPSESTQFVLLSATPPRFECSKWRLWSYADLAAIVRLVARDLPESESYYRQLLNDYADFAETLDELCSQTQATATDNFLELLSKPSVQALRSARIHDLVFKLAYQQVTSAVDDRLRKIQSTPEQPRDWRKAPVGSIWTDTAFTHGQGVSDVKLVVRGGQNPWVLGIQLQHDSLRLCLESAKPDPKKLEPAAERLKVSGYWFDFTPGAQLLEGATYPKPPKQFNRFGKVFLYRSQKLADHPHGTIGYDDVADLIYRFIEFGIENRDRIAEVIDQI